MALILAIEPDRRQAAQLTSLIRRHTGAELVLADTTERAIGAIGHRVPDLVLVPALLSPQDDAALAEALRAIAGAAHVQTLTIPMLALLLAIALLIRVARSKGAELNRCLALAGALEWMFGILYVVGVALA